MTIQKPIGAAPSKKARRLSKRIGKQERSAAVQAENWNDREGRARPTPERKAKGAFVLRDGDDAGVTVAVDEDVTELDRMRKANKITTEQCNAGHDFAAMINRMLMVPPPRSCLNFEPVGYDDSDEETHTERRDREDRTRIHMRCMAGPWVWAELRRVCVDNAEAKHMPSLLQGLDICVAHWGLQVG